MSELVFIGTSDAFGAGGRRQSAIFLRGPSSGALVDCGMTTGTGLAELGIERDEVDAILISHFHGDHFGGIPAFLLAALYEDQRTEPLRIAGPPGIQRRVYNLADAMAGDRDPLVRREHQGLAAIWAGLSIDLRMRWSDHRAGLRDAVGGEHSG